MRIRRSEEEIKSMLQEFDTSNVTVQEFCEIYSISRATFWTWRRKYCPKEADQGGFFKVIGELPSVSSDVFAEVEVPGKAIIRLFEPVEPQYLKSLL